MKPIFDITPFSIVDFEGKISAVVWFCGCNMRCVYCYNTKIVSATNGKFGADDLYEFLKMRRNKLDAVVFSGGECTNCHEILEILKYVKNLGFLNKIDTNGSNPDILAEILKRNLADFISLDFKAGNEKFFKITKTNGYENFIKSLKILVKSGVKFEVRTTIHSDFLNETEISKMAGILENYGYKGEYCLQNFYVTDENFGNLKAPKIKFDPAKIKSNIKIKLRNF